MRRPSRSLPVPTGFRPKSWSHLGGSAEFRGGVRTDMPLSWQVTVVQSVLHAGLTAVHTGELSVAPAPALICKTALAALRNEPHAQR